VRVEQSGRAVLLSHTTEATEAYRPDRAVVASVEPRNHTAEASDEHQIDTTGHDSPRARAAGW